MATVSLVFFLASFFWAKALPEAPKQQRAGKMATISFDMNLSIGFCLFLNFEGELVLYTGNFNGLAVKNSWLVLELQSGLNGGAVEQRTGALVFHYERIAYRTVLGHRRTGPRNILRDCETRLAVDKWVQP